MSAGEWLSQFSIRNSMEEGNDSLFFVSLYLSSFLDLVKSISHRLVESQIVISKHIRNKNESDTYHILYSLILLQIKLPRHIAEAHTLHHCFTHTLGPLTDYNHKI